MAERFDWQKAYASLARFEAKLKALDEPPPEDARRILQGRARSLALPPPAAGSVLTDFIVFRVGAARYAVEARQAASVLAIGKPTPLPGAPAFYLGLINHHGTVYPLLDIRPLLGGARAAFAPEVAIVARSESGVVAIAAEEIENLAQVDPSTVAPFDEESRSHAALRGLILESVIVIDLRRLLQDARLVVNEQPAVRIK